MVRHRLLQYDFARIGDASGRKGMGKAQRAFRTALVLSLGALLTLPVYAESRKARDAQNFAALGPVVPSSTRIKRAEPAPQRYYAIDGQSFYVNGQRVRANGLRSDGDARSAMAKQRLQMALDSGEVIIDLANVDTDGTLVANVSVSGRRLGDLLANYQASN